MIARIVKKANKNVCWFNWENWDCGSSFLLFCILKSIVIFYNLIDVDAHIKFIYFDSSHIKLLRESPKYRFLVYI